MEVKFSLRLSDTALADIQYFKQQGKVALLRKIDRLFAELELHPFSGTGQVEALRFELTGFYSRRINIEHRLLYRVDEKTCTVLIYRLRGHYLKK